MVRVFPDCKRLGVGRNFRNPEGHHAAADAPAPRPLILMRSLTREPLSTPCLRMSKAPPRE